MGFQFRKRTKGKNSWINFSGSKRNGLGASISIKFGKDITYNTRGRTTINFGNGFKYVAYRKKKRQPKHSYVQKRPTSKSSSKTYVYRKPQENSYELMSNIQQSLVSSCKVQKLTHSSDLQVVTDLYNAIEFLKEDPNSQHNRDLIVVTANQYKEICMRSNDPILTEHASNISRYLKSKLPPKPKPVTQTVDKPKRNYWLWGSLIAVICIIQMCTG